MVYVDATSDPLPIYFGGVFRPNKNYFLLPNSMERKEKLLGNRLNKNECM